MRLFWLLFAPAFAYQVLAILAETLHLYSRRLAQNTLQRSAIRPAISVLKPLRGLDPNTYEAFVSQVEQDYPEFEVLFGVANLSDPVTHEVRRLQQAFPAANIQLIVACADVPNRKAGVLMELARHARYDVWLVNDSDIKVTPQYLSEVVQPLANPNIGLVTCPYRPKAHNLPTAWEALGIATDFMPSALVAPLVGVREFGLGSTLVFRAADLQQVGGFAAVADYLADDYQLAKQITGLGRRALLSTYVVETSLGDTTWIGAWQHQLRWARTIRLSKGGGYAGLPFTHAGLWIAIAALTGAWPIAICLTALRILSAAIAAGPVLHSKLAFAFSWLAPLWDLYAFCVWTASYLSRKVRWRDRALTIGPSGRIET